jgi:hypothetical protein
MYALEHTSTFFASIAVIRLSKRGLCDSKGMKPLALASIVLTTPDIVSHHDARHHDGLEPPASYNRSFGSNAKSLSRFALLDRYLHAFLKRRPQRRLFLR